jgi:hypothetical protein
VFYEYITKEKTKEDFKMRALKIFYAVPVFLFLFAMSANADPTRLTAGTETELKDQLGDEIRNVLQSRFLKYDSDDLGGEVLIEATVQPDGKIIFKGMDSSNEHLRTNVFWKLYSLNLWTYPDYANTLFRYKIVYTD